MGAKKTGLTVVIGALLIVLVLGSLLDYRIMVDRTLRQRTYASLEKLSQYHQTLIHARLEEQFILLETHARYLSANLAIPREELLAKLQEEVAKSPFQRLELANQDGLSLDSNGAFQSMRDRDCFRQGLLGQRTVSQPPKSAAVSKGESANELILSVPMMVGGQIQGVMCASYQMEGLERLLVSPLLEEEETVLIASRNGDVLASSRCREQLDNLLVWLSKAELENPVDLKTIEEDLLQGKSRALRLMAQGQSYFVAYRPLELNGWYLASATSATRVNLQVTEMTDLVYTLCAKLLLGCFLLTLAVVWVKERQNKTMEAEKESLRISEERYRIVTSMSDSAIFEYRIQDQKLISAENFFDLFGWSLQPEGFPQSWERSGHIHRDDLPHFQKIFQDCIRGQVCVKEEMRIKTIKDYDCWCRIRMTTVSDAKGAPGHLIGKITNIDREKRETLLLKEKAERDSLTGVYNKRSSQIYIDYFLRTQKDPKGCHALLIVDIDNFKQVNDTLGHLFGDAVLTEVCQKLGHLLYPTDLLGRIGGDEFVIFLRDIQDEEHAQKMAAEICRVFRRSYAGDKRDYKISGSVGVALASGDSDHFEDLYRKADGALYAAKRNGKDQYAFYREEEILTPKQAVPPGLAERAVENLDVPCLYDDLRAQVFSLLYGARDFDSSVNLIFSLIGEHFRAGRVYVWEHLANETLPFFPYHWSCEDDSLGHAPLPPRLDASHSWVETDVFYCPDITVLGEAVARPLFAQGLCGMLQVEIMDKGSPWGLIGLDCLAGSSPWTQEEMAALTFLCRMIGMFILRHR